jgi:hypothetical protein
MSPKALEKAAGPAAFSGHNGASEGEPMFRHVPRDTRRSSCYESGGSSFCPI